MSPSPPTASGNDGSAVTTPGSGAAPSLSNLTKRLLVALVGVPLLVAAIWFCGPWYTVLVYAAALIATWEFNRLASAAEGDPFTPLLYGSVLLLLLDAYTGRAYLPAILTGILLLALVWSVVSFQQRGVAVGWLWTLGGSLYIGWLLSHYLVLRDLDQGRGWVLFAVFATFVNDTASYAVGRMFGKHHMVPNLSPGKTWEGAAGGLVATVLSAPLLALALGLSGAWTLWPLGLAVSAAAQVGDLAESMLKRAARVKDASALVPGHGGVLDRLDSLVLVGPLIYYYVVWVIPRA